MRRPTALVAAALPSALFALLAPLALLTVTAAPASATAYRYWAFWSHSGGSWSYQTQGPNSNVPADGSVDGWRFGVSEDSAHALRPRPAVAPSFAQLCAKTPAVNGKKRVAVVIDAGAGTGGDAGAPAERGACAVLDPQATSAQLLAQVAPPLRYDVNGVLCAISGYPAQGCGDAVADPNATTPTPSTTAVTTAAARKSGGSSLPVVGWVGGAVLVALLGGAAWWQNNRRRRQAN